MKSNRTVKQQVLKTVVEYLKDTTDKHSEFSKFESKWKELSNPQGDIVSAFVKYVCDEHNIHTSDLQIEHDTKTIYITKPAYASQLQNILGLTGYAVKVRYEESVAYHLAPIEYVPLIMSQGLIPQPIKNRDHANAICRTTGLYLWEHYYMNDMSFKNRISKRDKKIITDLIFAKNYYHPRNMWSFLYFDEISKLYSSKVSGDIMQKYCDNLATQLYYESYKNYIFMKVIITKEPEDYDTTHMQEHKNFPEYSHKDKHIIIYSKTIPPKNIELLCEVNAKVNKEKISCKFKNIVDVEKYYLTEKNIRKYSKRMFYE